MHRAGGHLASQVVLVELAKIKTPRGSLNFAVVMLDLACATGRAVRLSGPILSRLGPRALACNHHQWRSPATITKLLPQNLAERIIAAKLPVSSVYHVGLALVYSATAIESSRVENYSGGRKACWRRNCFDTGRTRS